MNFLPSKKFLTRAGISLLLIGGWFYFSSSNSSKIASNENGKIENNGGVLVFSRNKDTFSTKTENTNEWNISGDTSANNTGGNLLSDSSGSNTASVSGAISKNSFTPIALSELKTVDDDSTKALQKYAEDLVFALKPYSYDGLPNEGFLTMNAIENNNAEDLKKVGVMSELHKVVGNTLLKIQVPNVIAPRHLSLLNNILKISYFDKIMSGALEDPTNVMASVNGYKKETGDFINSITDINDFFKTKNITFTKGEKIKIYINSIE